MTNSAGTAAGRFGPAGTWAAVRVAKTMVKTIDLRIREYVEIRNIVLPPIAIRERARVLSFMLFLLFPLNYLLRIPGFAFRGRWSLAAGRTQVPCHSLRQAQ